MGDDQRPTEDDSHLRGTRELLQQATDVRAPRVTWLSRCSGGGIGSSSSSSCSSISTQHSSRWCCVGLVSCVWYVVWSVIARHDVAHHPWISHGEKQHILQSSHSDGTPPVSLYLLTYSHCPHSMLSRVYATVGSLSICTLYIYALYQSLCLLTTTATLQPFNGLFSRTTWVSRYQKGKTKALKALTYLLTYCLSTLLAF